MKDSGLPVRIFPDPDALSRAAADLIASIEKSKEAGSHFTLALSGGSTPRLLYSLLGSSPYRDAVAWDRVHFFWTDERCVPPDDRDSNYRMAFETLLSPLSPAPDHVHRIRGESGASAAAALYEEELARCFRGLLPRFDVMLLGAGNDGHTASLFPGSPAIQEKNHFALPVHRGPSNHDRVTLTLPVLNNAAHGIILATGAEKAGIVSEIVEQGNRKGYPAGLVRPVRGTLAWMIDQHAAAALLLPGGTR